jgi:hypothetical protein
MQKQYGPISFEDGDSMFLQNSGFCLRVYMALQPRRWTSPSSEANEPQIPHDRLIFVTETRYFLRQEQNFK